MNDIKLKIVIDGKEAVAAIRLTETEIDKLQSKLGKANPDINDRFRAAAASYKDDLENHRIAVEEKALTDQEYHKKLNVLEKESLANSALLWNENLVSITSAYTKAFAGIYSAAKNSADDEITNWKNKEEKKIEEEHKSALKHARTQKQREKVDEEYQHKKEKLDEEANEKAEEKLLTWFRLQQAANIAQTIMSTYNAATAALKPPPEGLGPVWGIPLSIATVISGLANVEMIRSQKLPAYYQGGRLPEGQQGFIEGWHNELIAPEKTFENIMRTELIPRVINNVNTASDPALIEEIRAMRGDLKNLKVKAYMDNHQARKVVLAGMEHSRRETL